jgi:hypothetical protein
VFVLGLFAWLADFNIFKFIRYIKEELLIVLGTSSSESVLPRMIAKMENLGREKSVVGLVIPMVFNHREEMMDIHPAAAGTVPSNFTRKQHPAVPRWSGALVQQQGCGRREPGGLRVERGVRPEMGHSQAHALQ